jgi:hypothetical protein
MRIVPPEHVMKSVARDYDGMGLMIFGERPKFGDMVDALRALEAEINALG